jgi:hypothetical protein
MSLFSYVLSEEDVKRKLKIDDFRYLTKDKIVEFASYLNRMDPEVAMKALEQVPEFALTAKEAIVNIQKIIDKGMVSNNESVKEFYYIANENAKALRQELNKETLSSDDRKYVIMGLLNITKMVYDKDSENKKFISDETKKTIGAVCGAVAFVGISLGLSFSIGKPLLNKIK